MFALKSTIEKITDFGQNQAAVCFHMHYDTKNLLIFVSKEELLICSRLRGQYSAKQEIENFKNCN